MVTGMWHGRENAREVMKGRFAVTKPGRSNGEMGNVGLQDVLVTGTSSSMERPRLGGLMA